PALSTPSAAQGEAAPVEAVRAIAALLGRAALPGSASGPTSRPAARVGTADDGEATPRGDREVLITGSVATLSDAASDAVRSAQKRQRRAVKQVQEVLERLSSDAPDALST
ncbi:MAG: hypothetical protein NWQ93_01400, partial [bacterium Ellin6529]|nr:hypothetical protein [bacterium Ellin6529]